MQEKSYQMLNESKHYIFVLLTSIAGLLYMLFLLFFSTGTPMHDEIGHFLLSRDAWLNPMHIFDLWGRTLQTLLYMLPAHFGLSVARLLSVVFALCTVWYSLQTAKLLNLKNYYLVALFLWFQPWFADNSYLVLTEVPFSLVMILGAYLYLKNHPRYASMVIGLLPLIRHEGVALVALFAVFMLYKKDWLSLILPWAPLCIFTIVYYYGTNAWPFALYLETTPNKLYGSGTWSHFFIRLFHPRAVGIPMMILIAGSIVPLLSSSRRMVVFSWYLSYFLLHTVIYRFGLFASGGFKLFLIPLAPVCAIAAVFGLNWYIEKSPVFFKYFKNASHLFKPKSLYSIACIVTVFTTLLFVKPYSLGREDIALKKAAAWVQAQGLTKSTIISTHVYFYYFLPLRVPVGTLWEKFPTLDELPAGTVLVWDMHFSDRWGLNYKYLSTHPTQWERLKDFEDNAVVIFRKKLP